MSQRKSGISPGLGLPPLVVRAPSAGDRAVALSDAQWEEVIDELSLSARQGELVRHIFNGKKQVAIAEEMGLGLGTIKTYFRRVYRKLGVTNRSELVARVLFAHLILVREGDLDGATAAPTVAVDERS